jgi:hypothetical protein
VSFLLSKSKARFVCFVWALSAIAQIAHHFEQLPFVLVHPEGRAHTATAASLILVHATMAEGRAQWKVERLLFDLGELLVDVLHLPILLLSGHLSRGKAERF